MYGDSIVSLHKTRFRDIFEDVAGGVADVGVVPIENALAGSVHENYDLLHEYNCFIVGEHYCPVHLHLLGLGTLEQVRRVVSHPKALEQCSRFFDHHSSVEAVIFSDTAGAAQHVAQTKDPSLAAIASEEAATGFGLTIIQRRIQNHASNFTRFVAISREPSTPGDASKGSIVVHLRHEPGSLYKLLGRIADAGLNLTKIESRPIEGKPFEYAFHLDLETSPATTNSLAEALGAIEPAVLSFRLLGLYHRAA